MLTVYSIDLSTNRPYTVKLQVEQKPLKMEIDTEASVSLVSEETFHRVLLNLPIAKLHCSIAYPFGTVDCHCGTAGRRGRLSRTAHETACRGGQGIRPNLDGT